MGDRPHYLTVHNFQIDIAAASTEGTNRRHCLGACPSIGLDPLRQRPSGTERHAGPAKGARRAFQWQVSQGCRPGGKPPTDIVDGSLDDQLLVGPDAPGTEDTLAKVALDEGVDFLNHCEVRNPLKIYEANPQISGDLAQLAAVALIAYQAGIGVAGQHQFEYGLAAFQYLWGAGIYHHSRGYRGNAGGQQCAGALVLHQAYPASTIRVEV